MSSAGMPTTRLEEPPIRWEYNVAAIDVSGFFGPNVDVNAIGEYLNERGDAGWELVTVVDVNRGNGTTSMLMAIMKRQARG